MRLRSLFLTCLLVAFAAPAWAGDLEVTVRVLPDGAGEAEFMRELALPPARPAGGERGRSGREPAAAAAGRGAGGQERAAEARGRGAEMRERARERRDAAREQGGRPAQPPGAAERPGGPPPHAGGGR